MAENPAAPRRRGIEEVKEIFRSLRKRIRGGKKTFDTARTLSGQSLSEQRLSGQRLSGSPLLYNVPPEILWMYTSFLDDASIVCLSYTSKALKDFFELNPASFGRCLRWIVTSRLEQGDLILSMAGKRPYPKELCCMACKKKHPRYQFDGDSYRKLFPSSPKQFFDQPFMNLPPVERVCGLVRPKCKHINDDPAIYSFVDPAGQPITMAERAWLKIPILTCTHCNETISMAGNPDLVCRNPLCNCTTCLKVLRPEYLRFGPLFTRVLEVDRFKYDSKGNLRIIERGAGPILLGPVQEVANPFHPPAPAAQ